jgi:hypothetical protein
MREAHRIPNSRDPRRDKRSFAVRERYAVTATRILRGAAHLRGLAEKMQVQSRDEKKLVANVY